MKLSDKIWLTKKCRMEAENRFNRYDFCSKNLITYYSAFILILSLYDFVDAKVEYTFSIVASSLIILILSLIVTSMRFKERALSYKQCYIKLNELQEEAVKAESENNSLDDIFRKYNDVLNLTENHSEYDYFKVKYYHKSREEYLSLSGKELFKLIVRWVIMFLITLSFVLLPLVIFLFGK